MADLAPSSLQLHLEHLTSAELASLVIELVADERVAVPLGEELYRRLNWAAPSAEAANWFGYQPAQPVAGSRPNLH